MRLNEGTEWNVELVATPAKEPLEIDQVRDKHIRVISDADEAEYIQGLIAAGRFHAEWFTRRKLITQTWRLWLDHFPRHQIDLPFSPLQSLTSIQYVDSGGTLQTWASTKYKLSPPASTGPFENPKRSRIRPAFGEVWPDARHEIDAIQIQYVCGYGDDGKDVPAPILHGIKMVAAELYVHRKNSLQDVFQHPAIIRAENMWWRFRLQ